jgi:diaminopimelate decarboxylase
MREFAYRQNTLVCDDVAVADLAKQFGTPLYVYSKSSLIDHCRHIEKSFTAIDHLTCYASKANSNRELLSVLSKEGIGVDVGSGGELYIALAAGFAPSHITYSGVGKLTSEIEYALKSGIHSFNVESEEELTRIDEIARRLDKKAGILLRVNLDIDAGTHPYITTSRKHNKFGVESGRAGEVLTAARRMAGVDVLGIHMHIGSQIVNVETFITAANAVVKLAAELRAQGIPIRCLNFGGGFGVTYRNFIKHPQLPVETGADESEITVTKFIEAIAPILQSSGCQIMIQPGRSIVAHAGILLTEVLYIKNNGGRTFVIVDAGMNDLMRPALYQSYHQIVPAQLSGAPAAKVDVVGPLCESGDFFALEREIPSVKSGDLLAVMCTGAYGYVLASNYNSRPRAAEVLVDGANSTIIREREKVENL